jgi:hypothetical protein
VRVARCISLALGAEHSSTTPWAAHHGPTPDPATAIARRRRGALIDGGCIPYTLSAGVEHGKLKHVPSTGDLLSAHVAVPPSIAAEARRAASDLSTALQVGPGLRARGSCAAETPRVWLPAPYQEAGAPAWLPHIMCSVSVP